MSNTIHFAIGTFVMLVGIGIAQQANPTAVPENSVHRGVIQLRPADTLFDPSRKKALSYRDGGLTITLVNGKKNLSVDIASESQTSKRIELPSEIVQVNEIRAAHDGKAIVVGMVNGSTFEIVILNTISISVADTFFAYSPSISPNGRFIAFVKFYPAHFVDGTDDHCVLYDTFRSASENRLVNGSLADRTNVGLPVFPRVPNRDGDNTDVPPLQQHHLMAQKFFWQSDSARYVFAETHATGEWSAVLVSLSTGVPSAAVAILERNQICARLGKNNCDVTLAEAELTPDGVLLELQGVGADSALGEFIEYDYRQFSPIQ
jgi:hypothetical protein